MWVTVGFSLKELGRIAREWGVCEVRENSRRDRRECGACGWVYGEHAEGCPLADGENACPVCYWIHGHHAPGCFVGFPQESVEIA